MSSILSGDTTVRNTYKVRLYPPCRIYFLYEEYILEEMSHRSMYSIPRNCSMRISSGARYPASTVCRYVGLRV